MIKLKLSTQYRLVAAVCVGTAFLISLRFIGKTRAQTEGAAPPPPPIEQMDPNNLPPGAQPPGAAPGVAQSGQAAALSELEGFLEPFIYDQLNRRDPFVPFAEYQPKDSSEPSRPLTPAQRFDLEQLHLVGIMWDVKEPKAMFMDPESEVLVLGRDEGIGNKNGYIAAIREGEVVVVEASRKRGDIVYKTRVLRMER